VLEEEVEAVFGVVLGVEPAAPSSGAMSSHSDGHWASISTAFLEDVTAEVTALPPDAETPPLDACTLSCKLVFPSSEPPWVSSFSCDGCPTNTPPVSPAEVLAQDVNKSTDVKVTKDKTTAMERRIEK
jgi:hypothetical protein